MDRKKLYLWKNNQTDSDKTTFLTDQQKTAISGNIKTKEKKVEDNIQASNNSKVDLFTIKSNSKKLASRSQILKFPKIKIHDAVEANDKIKMHLQNQHYLPGNTKMSIFELTSYRLNNQSLLYKPKFTGNSMCYLGDTKTQRPEITFFTLILVFEGNSEF
ncbi:MAG: hypothetical protein H0W50_02425 [Parachlamydiaceae bacterium]|nr:hypothetical protein [Parachlamydiaceae bacterium]